MPSDDARWSDTVVACSNRCPWRPSGGQVLAAGALWSLRAGGVRRSITEMGVPLGSGANLPSKGRNPFGRLLGVCLGWPEEPTCLEGRDIDQGCSPSGFYIRLF